MSDEHPGEFREFGHALRGLMTKHGISLHSLADRLECSRATLSEVMHGDEHTRQVLAHLVEEGAHVRYRGGWHKVAFTYADGDAGSNDCRLVLEAGEHIGYIAGDLVTVQS